MSWLKKLFGGNEGQKQGQTPPKLNNPIGETKYGMPVHEDVIHFEKLGRRTLTVTLEGQKIKMPINVIRAKFHAGHLPAAAHVVATSYWDGQPTFCGEGNVENLVRNWEQVPIETYVAEEVPRMFKEFDWEPIPITTMAEYGDLERLYSRCDSYYRYILYRDKEFKRTTKAQARDLVSKLDDESPEWDAVPAPDKQFAIKVKRHLPKLVRSAKEVKIKKVRDQKTKLERAEKQTITHTRNFLTRFPHKKLVVEIRDVGSVEVRALKEMLRDGRATPRNPNSLSPNSRVDGFT